MRLSPSLAILRTQSDERLAGLARAGSEAAFEAIVERYRRQLLKACRRVLAEGRAEDAVQQAFISAWMALQRGDDVANLRAWLLMIARNASLNALRSPGYDYAELQESLRAGAAPQDELERRDVMRQTLTGLAALPERQRDALLRSAVAGVAYAEIARDLGLSEGAARQLVLRARSTLRAAATAVVPWPLVQSLALSARGDAAPRIAELVTAGGGAGASALLAKAGLVAIVTGGAVVTPVVVRHERVVTPPAKAASRPAPGSARPAAISLAQPLVAAPAAPRAGGGDASADRRRDEDRQRDAERRSARDDDETRAGEHDRAGSRRDGSADREDSEDVEGGRSGPGGAKRERADRDGADGTSGSDVVPGADAKADAEANEDAGGGGEPDASPPDHEDPSDAGAGFSSGESTAAPESDEADG